jgi:hypothetical protein
MYVKDLAKEDFDAMIFNPLKVPKGELFFEFYKPFNPARNKDVAGLLNSSKKTGTNKLSEDKLVSPNLLSHLFVFVVLFLDNKSPFYGETDFESRKYNILLYLKYEKNSQHSFVVDAYNIIMNYEHPVINELTSLYFKRMFGYDFERWFSSKILFHQYTAYLRSNFSPNQNGDVRQDAEGRMKIMVNLPALQESIEELEAHIFKDDILKAKIFEKSLDDSYAGYAEKNAETLPFLQ